MIWFIFLFFFTLRRRRMASVLAGYQCAPCFLASFWCSLFMLSTAYGTKKQVQNTHSTLTCGEQGRLFEYFLLPCFIFHLLFYFFIFFRLFCWFYDGMQGLRCPGKYKCQIVIWYSQAKHCIRTGHTYERHNIDGTGEGTHTGFFLFSFSPSCSVIISFFSHELAINCALET